ncbi:nitrilase-related carbon-nitrogen hydrolase [Amnibacterium setariae]|uniref:Hydrolase n=1 Tax=Amnibacterium setariae TaxID=2306585 RepID=A0A3A1U477_9MICO|nr:nitrilase-related carbon-nitrogen hydrolase [Amnibacterium setariae]RIX27774.1 hydrolase [Amnibacterium setariae]
MTRIAAVQLSPVVGDLAGNTARAEAVLREVLAAGAEIVVLPELTTSGYVFTDEAEARGLAIDAEDPLLARWSSLLGDAVLVVGFAELGRGGRLYNSAAVLDRSGTRAVYRKVHLWDLEKRVFTPGSDLPAVVETPYGRLGVMVCFDLEFPEWTRIAALRGADLLAVPANWPVQPRPDGGDVPEVQIAAATARLNHMAVLVADRQGPERGVTWAGGTHVVGADGGIVDRVGPGDGVAWADLDLPASRDKRQGELVDLLGDRRPDLYGPLLA